MKLHVHNRTKVMIIQYKFNEIPFIDYLVMALDGRGRTDGQCQTKISPSSTGDNKYSDARGFPRDQHGQNTTFINMIYIEVIIETFCNIPFLPMDSSMQTDKIKCGP